MGVYRDTTTRNRATKNCWRAEFIYKGVRVRVGRFKEKSVAEQALREARELHMSRGQMNLFT
jgi:hypothetical protein